MPHAQAHYLEKKKKKGRKEKKCRKIGMMFYAVVTAGTDKYIFATMRVASLNHQ